MLRYIHQPVTNFVFPLFAAGQVTYSGFTRAFIHWKQLPVAAGNNADDCGETEQKNMKDVACKNQISWETLKRSSALGATAGSGWQLSVALLIFHITHSNSMYCYNKNVCQSSFKSPTDKNLRPAFQLNVPLQQSLTLCIFKMGIYRNGFGKPLHCCKPLLNHIYYSSIYYCLTNRPVFQLYRPLTQFISFSYSI